MTEPAGILQAAIDLPKGNDVPVKEQSIITL